VSLYRLGATPQLTDCPEYRAMATVGADAGKVSRTKVLLGIGATLALFTAIWALQRPSRNVPMVGVGADLEAKYRARGIDPRKVFG